jgi:hypothetical protein
MKRMFTVRYTTTAEFGLTGGTHDTYRAADAECRNRYMEQSIFTTQPSEWVRATWIDTTVNGIKVDYIPTIKDVG